MINLGQFNTLTISRILDQGAYLKDTNGNEVLLPARYLSADDKEGSEKRVFVYNDSEDRPVATTETPKATVGQVAMMEVRDDGKYGAFMDWGLAKDLLVPFSEQHFKLRRGMKVPIYVYLDHATMRVTGSAKLERYLGNTEPEYTPGTKVQALILERTDRGYKAAVDNLHFGLIYANEIYSPLEVGDTVEAYVKKVRDDGKIDLSLGDTSARHRKRDLTDAILEGLEQCGGSLPLGDKSSPDEIREAFSCSKRDFKQALGALLKAHKITIEPEAIHLVMSK